MDKTAGRIAIAPTAAVCDAHAQSPAPEAAAEQQQAPPLAARLQCLCGACLRFAAVVLVSYSFAATAWRVRHEPQELAFVVGACSLLGALLVCLRRAERLKPDSPAEEWRRVQAAVWLLSSVLSCAFAYRVAAIMPPALAVLVWCMTAFVVLTGFCLFVLCKYQQYQAIEDADAAGDRKAYLKISPTDELV